jgi:Zn-dependent protease with chaperone function
MNFFEHQERARRKTGLLVVLFVLAVAAIIVGVNLAVGLSMGLLDTGWEALHRQTGLLVMISLGTLALIGGATAFRVASLSSGGSAVAIAMDGIPVMPDTGDPQLRQLRNVVEEIALAAGVPTPQIFVMEKEAGINAFAAGYAPTDAVVAVTRGLLDHLTRDELQGVIAHEFSHIVNGDIRLNIRLMGVLFGILVIGVIGRLLLYGGRGSRNRGGIALLGVALFILGYIGVFFGRLIKSAVSRQREYLADAAAVQFTRQPTGIAGALKKIAALSSGSRLQTAESEEVSHMLFANGLRSLIGLLATHPPLFDRIRAIEPGFRSEEIDHLRKKLAWQRGKMAAAPQAAGTSADRSSPSHGLPGGLGGLGRIPGLGGGPIPQAVLTQAVLADLEQPDAARLAQAGALRDAMPQALYNAAHDSEAVVPLLLSLLLGDDAAMYRKHLEYLGGQISTMAMARLEALAPAARKLDPALRLPLMDLALPALRRRTPESLEALLPLVATLIKMDGRVTVFEYAMGRLLAIHVADILNPRRARPGGRVRLKERTDAVVDLFSVLAMHGHDDADAARAAFATGIATLYSPQHAPAYRPPHNWIKTLDAALGPLDALALPVKQDLIQGVVATIAHDGVVTVEEAELLRAVCGCLHVPLPRIAMQAQVGSQA